MPTRVNQCLRTGFKTQVVRVWRKDTAIKALTSVAAIVMMLVCSVAGGEGSAVEGKSNHGKSLDAVLHEIRQAQGIKDNERIDCDKLTDQQFEEVGEAVMSLTHPDPKEHEIMDRMMGGEGSPTLSAMHRMMGAAYLGCYRGGMLGHMMPGMMGSGMMGAFSPGAWQGPSGMMNRSRGWHMMDYWDGGWFMMFMGIIFLVLLGFGIYLIVHSTKSRPSGTPSEQKPLDILKKRYARGDITKEEFERMKEDLEK
jgi:putative membrane protein